MRPRVTLNTPEDEELTSMQMNGARAPRWCGARRRVRTGMALVATVGLAAVVAAPAAANPSDPGDFGLAHFETGVMGSHDAGAHPDVMTKFRFSAVTDADGTWVNGVPKVTEVDLPYGLIGNPQAVPTCRREQLAKNACPPQSLVGHAHVIVTNPETGQVVDHDFDDTPIFNMAVGSGAPAQFALALSAINNAGVFLDVQVRGDGGLRIVARNLPTNTPVLETTITMWGVPADQNPCNPNNPGFDPTATNPYDPEANPCPTTDPADWERRPFMTSPTDCDTYPVTRIRVFDQDGRTSSASFQEPDKPQNCDSLVFEPEAIIRPESREAGAPTAVNVELLVPQNDDPDGRATPHVRDVSVTMPEGLTINPGTARDLSACSDASFGKGQEGPASCPAGSKIGSLGITTPLMSEPLPGDIYLGEPKPGQRFRLFLYAEGKGVRIKLEGEVRPDPQTGQLTAVFRDNPPLPFSRFQLRFRGGNNAVLAMPATCGSRPGTIRMAPYSGQPSAERVSRIQVYGDEAGNPCPEQQPFNPSFVAGTTIPGGGSDTGLALSFSRTDQEQLLGGLRMEMPAGLLGRLASFPLCSVQDAMNNACSEDSMVGGVTVSAGAGNSLLNLPGRVFLTQPFKEGQIAGLAIVVRALAGPYDLGTVIVRTGIKVNPDTSLSVESDPLPTILEGIPLRLRQVVVNIDRPGFMFNPTDCSPKTIGATLLSPSGTEASRSSYYQVKGCHELPFEPPMTMKATAPDASRGNVMGLDVTLGGVPGHANARQVQVVLPSGVGARLDGPLQSACTEEDFAADRCSDASKIGTAQALTPILPAPLSGNVYFLENGSGGGLPRLAVRLKGMVQLDLVADIEVTRGGRVVNTFSAIPDVPIDRFDLHLDSGQNAVLTGSRELCGKRLSAELNMIGHNGKSTNERVPVTLDGCAKRASSKGKAKGGKKGGANKRGVEGRTSVR